MKTKTTLAVLIFLLILVSISSADIKLPSIISDSMVLQQQSQVPIWGTADPGEKISVRANFKVSAQTTAGSDGKWSVKLKTPKAGGPYTITVKGNNTIKLSDVLIGEVWICSGQSNMQWSLNRTDDAEKHIAEANFPNIRLFTVKRAIASEPQTDCEGNWSNCSPETVPAFSAVAYYFGNNLHKELNVPIGLISTNWGGTLAEAWTRKECLEKDEMLKPILERYDAYIEKLPQAQIRFTKQYEKWKELAKKAKAEGKKPPRSPQKPVERNQNSPSSLYNAMLSPLIPYSIKGAIWYQGESNVGRAYQYRTLFPTMITNWRTDWAQGDFPFYFVQLAPFKYNADRPSQELREAQMMTLSLPNTGMAVTMDIGNPTNIHPTNKLDVGKRLALWALAKDYHRNSLIFSGPLYRSMNVEGSKVRLSFSHIGTGLLAKDGQLSHFTIAGKDKKFVDASAVIDGKTIVVSSDQVTSPVAVRYGWSNTAEPNLFNKEMLPASSFRTDDWPGKTYNAR